MNKLLSLLRRLRNSISGIPTADKTISPDLPEQSTVVHPTRGVGTLVFNGQTEDGTMRAVVISFADKTMWMKPTEGYLSIYPALKESTELQ